MIARNKTACFSGHRNISKQEIFQIEKRLEKTIEILYKKGVIFFGAGGAYGFDMLAEKAVIKAKRKHQDIKLILVLPCKNQYKYWNKKDIIQYKEILSNADKIVYTAENYYNGCMQKRNKHLVNYSGYCICYLYQNTGGTAFTVNYAKSKKLTVINLYNTTTPSVSQPAPHQE